MQASATLPKQLGRYHILKRLTTGGMTELLLGRATGPQDFARHVAIKRLHRVLAEDPAIVQTFLEEARLAASLHHHNIIQVQDVGEQDGQYFFAMEYVHGEDLRALLAKARARGEHIPLEVVLSIVMSAAAGLHHAHDRRGPDREPLELVHRDVSLGNILVGYDGSVKLLDFGLARAAQRSAKTQSGALKGKAEYLSPEQCAGKPVDRRSDVFGLGIVLHELVTGRRMFQGATEFQVMQAIVNDPSPAPSSLRAGLPPGLDAIVLRALAKDREERFASAEAMHAALEELARDAGLRSSTKLLADYLALAFGERPEPWRVDLAETRTESPPEFTEEAATIATPPPDFKNLLGTGTITIRGDGDTSTNTSTSTVVPASGDTGSFDVDTGLEKRKPASFDTDTGLEKRKPATSFDTGSFDASTGRFEASTVSLGPAAAARAVAGTPAPPSVPKPPVVPAAVPTPSRTSAAHGPPTPMPVPQPSFGPAPLERPSAPMATARADGMREGSIASAAVPNLRGGLAGQLVRARALIDRYPRATVAAAGTVGFFVMLVVVMTARC